MKTYKKCSIAGCNGLVFAHNVCKYHQNLILKKVPRIPKGISSHKGISGNISVTSQFTSQVQMFKYIWRVTQHKSFLTKRYLDYTQGDEIWYSLFAHVLSKNHFPLFRLNEENIILLTPYEHILLDKSTKARRDKYSLNWWAVKEKAEMLWKEYNEIDPNCNPLPKLYQFMT